MAEPERTALERRYLEAVQEADIRGCRAMVDTFEAAAKDSRAVINRPLADVERLASSDQQIYATYYERLDAGVQTPYGNAWDRWRRIADATLFPLYEKRIRFAALSLDGVGVLNYGDCSLVLRDELVADRTTVFEENSAVFMRDRGPGLALGRRATWDQRARLCVAKLASAIHAGTAPSDFPGLLLRQGAISEDDRFVEVHIWGSLTARTCERAILILKGKKPRQAFRKAFQWRLAAVGIKLEVR